MDDPEVAWAAKLEELCVGAVSHGVEWRAAREEDIRRAYADKECWNDLDRITCQHPYSFNAIEQWPLDAAGLP